MSEHDYSSFLERVPASRHRKYSGTYLHYVAAYMNKAATSLKQPASLASNSAKALQSTSVK